MADTQTPHEHTSSLLIVDESSENTVVLLELLSDLSIEVFIVSNPFDVIGVVDQKKPDIIFLDIEMLNVQGFQTFKILKESLHTASIPIVIMSESVSDLEPLEGFEEKGLDFLSKPYNKPEVLAKVSFHLKQVQLQKKLVLSNDKLIKMENKLKTLEANLEKRTVKLKESEERLTQAIDVGNLGLFDIDLSTREISANYLWYMIVDISPSTPAGELYDLWYDKIHPHDKAKVDKKLQKLLSKRKQEPYSIEVRYQHSKNGEIWLHIDGKGVTGRDPKVSGHQIGFMQDVTERKEYEQRLLDANNLSQQALALTQTAYWKVDFSDAGYFYITDELVRLLGFPKNDENCYSLLGDWYAGMQAADKELADESYTAFLNAINTENTPFEAVFAFKRSDTGRIEWAKAAGEIIRDKDGKALVMNGVLQIITLQKLQEQQILIARNRLESLFEHMPNAFAEYEIICNDIGEPVDYRFVSVNPAFGIQTGLTDDVIGKTIKEVLPEYEQSMIELYGEVALKGTTVSFERYIPSIDKCFQAIAFSVEKGCFASILIDISDRRKQEEELLKAKEAAETAARTKSQFLATMSHEIRTPMNGVVGLTHLLGRTDLNYKQRDYLNKILQSSDTLQRIIDDILDFTKIEGGHVTFETTDFNLEQVQEKLTVFLDGKVEDKEVELIFNTSNTVPYNLKGDPLRLEQILLNLVNNAIKFTPTGEVVVSTTLLTQVGDDIELEFRIKDSGIGMTDRQLKSLFKPFTQADSSTTRKFGGTGLGLAISKKLVELMGGEIHATSIYGEGSEFVFNIKIKAGSNVHQPSIKIPQAENLQILLVDDSDVSRRTIREILLQHSFSVLEASSGKEAIGILRNGQSKIDLLLIDWKMPEMDGILTIKEIQKNPMVGHIPTILMFTPFHREEGIKEAMKLPVEVVLNKPIYPSHLLSAIMDAVCAEGKIETQIMNGNRPQYNFEYLHGARILLVEDNEINQEIGSELLEAEGFIVDVADNGKIAIDKVLKTDYSAVLMDIQMPIMDGVEATEILRSMEKYKQLPIIAMTANVMPEDSVKYQKIGMNANVSKPIKLNELFAALSQWVVPPSTLPKKLQKSFVKSIHFNLPGINTSEGLARTGHNADAYKSILLKVLKEYRNVDKEIEYNILQNNFSEALRLIHAIKGVFGNVGAQTVYLASEDLEQALKLNSKSLLITFEKFKEKLDYVFDSLEILEDMKIDELTI